MKKGTRNWANIFSEWKIRNRTVSDGGKGSGAKCQTGLAQTRGLRFEGFCLLWSFGNSGTFSL